MKKFYPYKIIDIDLSEQNILIPPQTDENGLYVVLWWKDIAIGDCYVDSRQELPEKKFQNKIITAILPVIDLFTKETNYEFDWRNYLLANQIHNWRKLDLLFSRVQIKKYPKTVPISVLICTRNRALSLSECLKDLKNSISQPEEIVVIDNAPEDLSTQEIVKQFPKVKYIIENRIGLDIARNTGIKNAEFSTVAFVDDDVRVHPAWAFRVWETFQNSSISAMTGLVIASEIDTEAQFIFERFRSFNRGYLDKIYDKEFLHNAHMKMPAVWEIGAGANMAFRKSVFEEVGYFHELLDVGAAGCSGDSEMWFRVLAQGRSIQYNSKVIVYHKHRKTIKELKKQLFHYIRGFTTAALWQQKQMPELGYRDFIFFKFPIYLTKMLIMGFPNYNGRYKTIWVEVKGFLSGIRYFYKKENRSKFAIKK